jgi:TRAP-type C4-dicarboxylate transport system substrate-binding protein
MRKTLFAGSVLAVAAALFVTPITLPGVANAAEFEMKVGFVTFRDQQHKYADFLKEEIEAATNGRIEVKIFPRGELGPIPAQIEGTQLGTQAMYIAPSDFFAGIDSRFGVFSIPTLFRNKAHAAITLMDPTLQGELRGIASDKNLKVAAVFVHSAAHYMAKKPLTSLASFDGLKIRINATKAERERMARFGATGIPMSLGEVLPALQQGTIDGTMSSIAIYANLGYIDFSDTLLKTEDSMIISSAVLSPAWLNTLPADLREKVVAISEGLLGRISVWSLNADAVLEAKWASQGGKIITLTADEQIKLVEKLASVGEDVTTGDAQASALLARLREVGARN